MEKKKKKLITIHLNNSDFCEKIINLIKFIWSFKIVSI
jgi:hypothetical protein